MRHVGDTVAMVVAETAAQARDAAELIAVDYEPLPAAVDTGAALDPGQPSVWDDIPEQSLLRLGNRRQAAVERPQQRPSTGCR